MSRNPFIKAEWLAETKVREYGLAQLPINPIAFAKNIGIEVVAKPASEAGVSGMLLRYGNNFGIAYATHIDSIGFRNFCVAHELGHYFLPGHVDALLRDQSFHESRAGFASRDKYELEADHFAASFLMPNFLFVPAIKHAGDGINAVRELADLCQTSLPATAIRFAQCTQEPVAAIVSTGNQINYCVMSDALKEIDDIDWIRRRELLPKNTATFAFNQNASKVQQASQEEAISNFQDWFGGKRSLEINEDVIGLGQFGKSLTLLYGIDFPEEQDDESSLLDGPRFRR